MDFMKAALMADFAKIAYLESKICSNTSTIFRI